MITITYKTVNSIHRFKIKETEEKVSIHLIDSTDFNRAAWREEAILTFNKETKEVSKNRCNPKVLIDLAECALKDELKYILKA